VATIFALLLVVSFIANYLATVLPGQMEVNELAHITTVENQVGRLQAIAYAESTGGRTGLPLTQPITLGSSGQPPFGQADSGILTRGVNGSNLSFQYESGATIYVPPAWGVGSLCTTKTATTCGSSQSNVCVPPLTWNESANGTSYVVTLTGSNDCVRLNVTGNNDVIALAVTGSNLGYLLVTLFGSNDTILLGNAFSGSGYHASFYLFGQNDTYEASGGPTGSHLFLSTYFIGEYATGTGCGVTNLSATDHWSITGSSSSNSIQNLTWYNSVGYATAYHSTTGWPGAGNSGTGDKVGWQNSSSPTNCAFWNLEGITADQWLASGIVAHLNNAYVAPVDVVYELGAEIYAQAGGIPVMLGGPEFHLTLTATGTPQVTLWLPEFTGNFTTDEGIQTASLVLKLISVTQASLPTTNSESVLLSPVTLTLHTAYAPAWMSYFDAIPSLFPAGATCTGAGCSTPYIAQHGLSTITVTLVDDAALTIQLALFSVTFE
jgi:hypothetical protein